VHDTGLADRLRARGVTVVEIAGWQTRGSATFDPDGSVNHHTAGSAIGAAPSLTICIYGRPDVPGPLAQVLLGRDLVAYLIAAGRANHAGLGGWRGLVGNSSVHGLEIEHTGAAGATSPAQLEVAVQIHAAFLEAPGQSRDAGLVCQHFEWAPTRKVDFRELNPPYTPASFRAAIVAALAPKPPPTEDDDMPATYRIKLADANRVAYVLPDGTVVDTDHTGTRITDGSDGDGAMKAVYVAKVANAVQVDRVQAMVRAARA